MSTVYFSNRLEILFNHLKKNFFSSHASFFSKRYLVVPDRKMASWIALQCVQDFGIATGYKTLTLKQATSLIATLPLKDVTALAFLLMEEIPKIASLSTYVENNNRRLTLLALHLASLFHRYQNYGGFEKLEGWQKTLWDAVYSGKIEQQKIEGTFHLFGFNHLSPLHFSLFQNVGASIYTLSPCKEFWSDLPTERHIAKMVKKEPALERFFDDVHPLLANFGKVGKMWASQVEESGIQTVEDYIFSEEKNDLQKLQNVFLSLGNEISLEDDSIQVHLYPTKRLEIEGLYKNLAPLIEEKKMEPKDIVVMAPDISEYLPFIKATFENQIPYQIRDCQTETHTLFFTLFDLEKKRWSVSALFELFRSRAVFNEEELEKIEKWVNLAGIRWGYDLEHVDSILKKRMPDALFQDDRHTWLSGINSLFMNLATHDTLSFKEADLLGKLASYLETLYHALNEFHDGTKKTVSKWCEKINNLISFDVTPFFEGADPQKIYSFDSLLPFLEQGFSKQHFSFHTQNAQSITFSSFHSCCPANCIYLLGMDHDALPRKERWKNLDQLKNSPTISHFDSYAFLEAILSARERLFVSYIGRSPFDQTSIPPSTLIQALGKKEMTPHFEFENFPVAKRKKFIEAFIPEKVEIPAEDHVISLKDLLACVRNPLRPYFKKKLKILFEKDVSLDEEGEFVLSPLKKAMLRKEGLKKSLNELLERAKTGSEFPSAIFNEISCRQIEKEYLQVPNTQSVEIKFTCDSTLIVGTIVGIQDATFYTLDSWSIEACIKQFPAFLLSNTSSWVFARDKKMKTRFFDDPLPFLRNLVEHYFYCEAAPCPLYPEFIASLLEGDEKKLINAMQKETFHDELRYSMQNGPPSLSIADWQERAKKLYGGLYDAWF